MSKKEIEIINSANGFFFEQLKEAINSNNIQLSEEIQIYVTDVLSRFVYSDYRYSINSQGAYTDEPLAFMMKEAEDEPMLEPKRLLFRKIGDIAMFTVGVFPEKKVSSEYYHFMGKTAYNQAAYLYSRSAKDLYRELSYNFELITFTLRNIPYLKKEFLI